MDLFILGLGILLVVVLIGTFVGIPAYFLRHGFRDGASFWSDLHRYALFMAMILGVQLVLLAWRGWLQQPAPVFFAAIAAWLIGLPYLSYALGRAWGNHYRKTSG